MMPVVTQGFQKICPVLATFRLFNLPAMKQKIRIRLRVDQIQIGDCFDTNGVEKFKWAFAIQLIFEF